ncbi:MAG TPA: hypothetical protein VLD63_01565 [Anaerolineales bacterium]|nr:hypothetical protein [Anaerolineales bacterium]
MNTKTLLMASFLGGLVSTVLVNAPFVNLINVLLCAGFWVGPFAAVWIYRRQAAPPTMGQAIGIGALAGLWHGVIGVALSFVGLAGASGMLRDLQAVVPAQDLPNLEAALKGAGAILFNVVGVAIDVVFGFIGGLIGGAIFRPGRAAA